MNKQILNNAINKWFDIKYKMYNKFEDKGDIYLYYDDIEDLDFVITKKAEMVYCYRNFVEEFCNTFSVNERDAITIITKWIENTFKLKSAYIRVMDIPPKFILDFEDNNVRDNFR